MVRCVDLKLYDDYSNYIKRLDPDGPPVFFFFSGWSGWSPDCVEAQSVIKAYLSETKLLEKVMIYISVDIDSRKYWKNPACPFRTDNRCKLTVIPTFIKWKGGQRLEGNQCKNRDLLQKMIEED